MAKDQFAGPGEATNIFPKEGRLDFTHKGIQFVNDEGIITCEIGQMVIRDLSILDAAYHQRAQLKALLEIVEGQIAKLESAQASE